jgi:NAD(P)-dependent dehydrogenase (short-subunit alcohol dehydrogenase family)
MSAPVYLVLGAGPGLGLATARRFAKAGYTAVLAGLTAEKTEPLAQTLRDEGFTADAVGVDLTSENDTREVVAKVAEKHGRIDVLHFNPSAWRQKSPLELTVAELLEDVTLGAASLLPALQAAAPAMGAGARVLVTGSAAADKPYGSAASLGVQKAAVRNLVRSIDSTMKSRGVRAVTMQINGELKKEGTFGPEAIAEGLYAAATRADDDAWTTDVPYPRARPVAI